MRLSRLLLAAAVLFAPVAAHASTLVFVLSGPTESGAFSITNSTPFSIYSSDGIIHLSPVELAGAPGQFTQVTFYTYPILGGISDSLDDPTFGGFTGQQIFVGDLSNGATFSASNGPITLEDPTTGKMDETLMISGDGSITYGAAAPEPSSLVLLGTGALGLAGAVRRRFSK